MLMALFLASTTFEKLKNLLAKFIDFEDNINILN